MFSYADKQTTTQVSPDLHQPQLHTLASYICIFSIPPLYLYTFTNLRDATYLTSYHGNQLHVIMCVLCFLLILSQPLPSTGIDFFALLCSPVLCYTSANLTYLGCLFYNQGNEYKYQGFTHFKEEEGFHFLSLQHTMRKKSIIVLITASLLIHHYSICVD